MMVGLYVYGGRLGESDLHELTKLDIDKMCLFVDGERVGAMDFVEEKGIKVCSADVSHEDHSPPCQMPENMVCVASEGSLYTCGLVLGDERFNLGNVFEKPLQRVFDDKSLPHTVPADIPHAEHQKCTACPPLMVKRVLGARH